MTNDSSSAIAMQTSLPPNLNPMKPESKKLAI